MTTYDDLRRAIAANDSPLVRAVAFDKLKNGSDDIAAYHLVCFELDLRIGKRIFYARRMSTSEMLAHYQDPSWVARSVAQDLRNELHNVEGYVDAALTTLAVNLRSKALSLPVHFVDADANIFAPAVLGQFLRHPWDTDERAPIDVGAISDLFLFGVETLNADSVPMLSITSRIRDGDGLHFTIANTATVAIPEHYDEAFVANVCEACRRVFKASVEALKHY